VRKALAPSKKQNFAANESVQEGKLSDRGIAEEKRLGCSPRYSRMAQHHAWKARANQRPSRGETGTTTAQADFGDNKKIKQDCCHHLEVRKESGIAGYRMGKRCFIAKKKPKDDPLGQQGPKLVQKKRSEKPMSLSRWNDIVAGSSGLLPMNGNTVLGGGG